MRTKAILKGYLPLVCLAVAVIVAFCFGSCKDNRDDGPASTPYDPSKPVLVTGFSPESGGVGQRLVIYGSNFGNDTAIVRVFVGGKEAKLIGLSDEGLYCIVPRKAFIGDIEVHVGKGGSPRVALASDTFRYVKKMVVSTVCGYRNDRDNQGWRNGPFTGPEDVRAAGFRNTSFMKFDPKNSKRLYVAYDNQGPLQLINFEDSTVLIQDRGLGGWDRLRSVDFTLDGDHMIIADDRGGENDISTSIMERVNTPFGFGNPQVLTRYKQCNGASIHPVNGELYFNSYGKGEFLRYETENSQYYGGTLDAKAYSILFMVQDNGWEFNIQMHPTGNYAYIVVINQHYILRTDYNWARRAFTSPYVVCGESRSWGYAEGVGSSARIRDPWQGVFVKNPAYAGKADEYDFYFCERHNHCISVLTPDGNVSTFAGRGSSSLNPDPWGFVEGDLRLEARFNQPTGLAYDEAENAFYVNDLENRRLRKISMESDD